MTARSGVSRKALRLYEPAGILPVPRLTAARYRIYGNDVLPLLVFVRRARRLGLRLDEITEVVAIKRSGRSRCIQRPRGTVVCPHIEQLDRPRKGGETRRSL